MKKIFLFLCAFALALSAAAGFAYNIDVAVGGVRYTGARSATASNTAWAAKSPATRRRWAAC